jgi:ubiquinone/menaquinone biosynthesis C-methylase UbiE
MKLLKDIKIYFQMMFNYKPKIFWNELLTNSFDLKGVGHYRLSNEENEKMYNDKKLIIDNEIIKNKIIINENTIALEVGCGVGYWTEFLKNKGVKNYTGNDIAEVSVNNLKVIYKDYNFIHGDISEIELNDSTYDIVFMIDVTQHITDDNNFKTAISNIWNSIKINGYFFVTMWEPSKNVYLTNKLRLNRIEKPRGMEWYMDIFQDSSRLLTNVDFNDKYLLIIQKTK